MLIISDEDKNFLKKNLKDAEKLFNSENVNDILDPLYTLIDEKGFAPPHYYDYNDFGREAQKVYDRIFLNNPD